MTFEKRRWRTTHAEADDRYYTQDEVDAWGNNRYGPVSAELNADAELPRKKIKWEQSGPVRAAKDLASSPKAIALPVTGLLTPEASSLAEEKLRNDFFPFLKLPAELRLHIYRRTLCLDEPLWLESQRKMPTEEKQEKQLDEREIALSKQNTESLEPKRKKPKVDVALLRVCSLVYKEARQVFYTENDFTLSIDTSVITLSQMHQRSRSLIKSVNLAIPSHHDILDSFADIVRLGLRYCWGLRTFIIRLDVMLPDFDNLPTGHHGGIYANAFRILRWLPMNCKIILEGNVNESVRRVVAEEAQLLVELDEVILRWHRFQEVPEADLRLGELFQETASNV
ncbi:hypothetical protein N0V90_007243 [Kalmusia sp. IMI 367209]|nr:hypothetical protein N0V90_007243 [Kalmusia sp. IMI 367209]